MKFQIKKHELSLATSRIQGASSDRSVTYLGLKTSESAVELSVADRILVIYSSHEADVSEAGEAFVPARLFSDVVRELPEGNIALETTDSYLVVTAGSNSEFVIKLPKVDDKTWRTPPQIETKNVCDLPSEKLHYIIDQVQFCVSQDSPRNYGSVGFIHKPKPDLLRFVGTDGFRLSYSELTFPLPDQFLNNGVCLSKRAMNEIQRMCSSDGVEKVSFSISDDDSTMVAQIPGYQIFIRLSSVKYPNYQGVLPSTNLLPVKVSRPYIQSVAKRVLLAADKSRALRLCFDDNQLTLKSRTIGSSEGKECVRLNDYEGGERELAVNGKYLSDVFSTIDSDHITLKVSSENDPIVVVPEKEPQLCHSMHVLVPIRETK